MIVILHIPHIALAWKWRWCAWSFCWEAGLLGLQVGPLVIELW